MIPQIREQILLTVALTLIVSAVAMADCGAEPSNLITNCGLDTDASGWSFAQGTCARTGSDGSSVVGSYECDSASDGFGGQRAVVDHTCISTGVVGGSSYGYGFDAKLASGDGSSSAVNCTISLSEFSDAACSVPVGVAPVSSVVSLNTAAPTAFVQNPSATLNSDMTTQSISLRVTCAQSSPSSAYTVRLDDFFLGVGLMPVELQSFSVN